MSQLQVTGEAKIRDIQGPVVANSGVITALDGAASQYVRGDGTLADFPTSTGGGSSVSYYLNSSVSQGTIGGVAYRQLGKTPIAGAGTDITISANGYVASYITDANDPALLEVPAGNFNCEFYFSVNSNNHNPYVYAEVYKYDGTTFTLIGSSQSVPEYLTNGTTLSPYYFAIPVTQTTLAITDRIAIRIYVNVDTKVVTLHTENNHLCQVVTTFSKGLTSLNNLTRQVQFLATGTSGTDFNISSSTATHTFNIPNASATNRGLITTEAQTIAGAKVFDNPITANSGIGFLNGVMPNITSNLYSGIGGNSQGISIITRPVSTNYTNNFYFPSASNSYTFPNATGTIALTSDISYPVTSVFGRTGAVVAASGDYTTTQVTEGTNLYFTDARARAALSAGTGISYNNTTGVITSTITQYTDALARAALSFTAGSGAYNSTTGVITIPTDNNQIANGAGYITSSALSGYLPLTGGTLTGGLNGTTATFSGLGTFNQITMTGATAGRLFYAQTGGVFSQSGNLVWNNSTEMLGVGTPNPSAVITAFSTNAATQFKAAGTAPAITFSNTLTSASLACVFGLATANNQFITGTAAGDMAIANQSTSAGAIVFGTGTFEKMRMTSSGNFAVGGTTDDTSGGLYTNIAINATSYSRYSLLTGGTARARFQFDGTNTSLVSTSTGGKLQLQTLGANAMEFNTNDTLRMTITSAGNVGIGTSSPTAKLTVAAPSTGESIRSIGFDTIGDNYITYYNTAGTRLGYIGYGYSGSNTFDIYNDASDPMIFSTAATERMRINSNGNIGMNRTGATNSVLGIRGQNQNSSTYCLLIDNAVQDLLQVRNDGLIFFGTAASAPYNYNVTFNPRTAGLGQGGDFGYITSTRESKGNIETIKNIDFINQLNPVSFNYRKKDSDKKEFIDELYEDVYFGFVADEVENVNKDLVFYDDLPDGTKKLAGVHYNSVIAILTKAVQDQQVQIEELKALIAAK